METQPIQRPPQNCSFCGKRREQVKQVVAGWSGALICNECIELCCEIMVDDGIFPPYMKPRPEVRRATGLD